MTRIRDDWWRNAHLGDLESLYVDQLVKLQSSAYLHGWVGLQNCSSDCVYLIVERPRGHHESFVLQCKTHDKYTTPISYIYLMVTNGFNLSKQDTSKETIKPFHSADPYLRWRRVCQDDLDKLYLCQVVRISPLMRQVLRLPRNVLRSDFVIRNVRNEGRNVDIRRVGGHVDLMDIESKDLLIYDDVYKYISR